MTAHKPLAGSQMVGRTYLERGKPVTCLVRWGPGGGPRNALRDLPEKLRTRIEIQADGCWLWRGPLGADGYGRIFRLEGGTYVHRQVYRRLVSEIAAGLVLDHLCRVRHCCNPAHLEPVTQRINVLRGVGRAAANATKTLCPRGHQYDYTYPDGRRGCRTCERARKSKGHTSRRKAC